MVSLLVLRITQRSSTHVLAASRKATQRRDMGFWSNIFVPSEREQRKNLIEDKGLLPGDPEWNEIYAKLEPSELAKQTGVPDQLIDDPLLHIAVLKYNKVKEFYSITNDAEFLERYNISAGVQSLEAALPTLIPHHTFDELPIIKENEEEGKEAKKH